MQLSINSMEPLTVVRLVGPVVEWITSLALVGIFGLMLPLTRQRRTIITWMIAWFCRAVSVNGAALSGIYIIARVMIRPAWPMVLQPYTWGTGLCFLAAVTLGSLATVGIRFANRVHYWIMGGAFTCGLLASVANLGMTADRLELVANVMLFFGASQMVFWRAGGPRRAGLNFLAITLTLYGVLSTIYLLDHDNLDPRTPFERFAHTVSISAGYGDALMLGMLAAAVIVVVVREAFLEASEAHERRTQGIAASESRLNGIIQSALEAIVTVGHDGRIELVNGAAERMFGLERAAILGRPLASLLEQGPANLTDLLRSPPDAVVDPARRPTAAHAAKARRPDGTVVELEFTIGRLHGEGRSGAVVVLHDLTARNAAQAQRDQFEHRMAESEKMLAIGRVVSGVAHELNNPLAVVLGQSEQMVEGVPAGEMRSGLNLIREQANRARHIVKDLLAFVRHRDEHRELVDLTALAERIVALQQATAAAERVTLSVESASGLPPVLVDRVAIEQVIVNLIDNGIDATRPGGRVTVGVQRADDCVEVVVEDSGSGVAAEMADRVFEPFFTTKMPGSGTGLGLSVSRAIAQQQGGSLHLTPPQPGRGARFVLSLPATAAGEPAPVEGAQSTFPGPPVPGVHTTAEVMLVDDEPAVRATLAKMFRRAGWQVREAPDGISALSWLDHVPDGDSPAVILCDLRMPGLDGQGMFERLAHSRPALAGRIIFVTGNVVQSVSSGFIAASGRPVVEKPFTIEEIGRAVRMVIATLQ